MPITKLKQITAVTNSKVYDDTFPMPFAEFSPLNLEDDLNFIRTQLKVITGEPNWFDPPQAPISAIIGLACKEEADFPSIGDWGGIDGYELTLGFVPYNLAFMRVFLNGQLLREGVGEDFTTQAPDKIQFNFPLDPLHPDKITIFSTCTQDGVPGGGNTLDQAYDEGGPGAGRAIVADSGPVYISNASSNSDILRLSDNLTDVFVVKDGGNIEYSLGGYNINWVAENTTVLPLAGNQGRVIFYEDAYIDCLMVDNGARWVNLCNTQINVTNNPPPDPDEGDRIYHPELRMWFTYDSTLDKWMSDAREKFSFGAGNKISDQYLKIGGGGAFSGISGWRMPRNGLITSINVQTRDAAIWDLEIRSNNNPVPIATLSPFGVEGDSVDEIGIDISSGDFLQAYAAGTDIPYPTGWIEVAWRLDPI